MKPLISYYGGKQRIASKIVPHILNIPHTVYAEPYAGGLSVLYAKGTPPITANDHYREAINDHSEDLINLYRVLCDLLDRIEASYILSNYPQPIEPKSAQQRVEIQASMSAAKCDRNRTQAMPLANTTRTEVLWICNRSANIRPELQPVLDQFFNRGTALSIPQIAPPRQQLSLF